MLSAQEAAGFAELVALSFVHKYTKSVVTAGAEDDWRTAPPTYGAVVVDLICNYVSAGQQTLADGSTTNVDSPTISVPATDTLKIGDRVSNIKDAASTVVLVGPLYVTELAPAMGFGIVTNYIATLSGQRPSDL